MVRKMKLTVCICILLSCFWMSKCIEENEKRDDHTIVLTYPYRTRTVETSTTTNMTIVPTQTLARMHRFKGSLMKFKPRHLKHSKSNYFHLESLIKADEGVTSNKSSLAITRSTIDMGINSSIWSTEPNANLSTPKTNVELQIANAGSLNASDRFQQELLNSTFNLFKMFQKKNQKLFDFNSTEPTFINIGLFVFFLLRHFKNKYIR